MPRYANSNIIVEKWGMTPDQQYVKEVLLNNEVALPVKLNNLWLDEHTPYFVWNTPVRKSGGIYYYDEDRNNQRYGVLFLKRWDNEKTFDENLVIENISTGMRIKSFGSDVDFWFLVSIDHISIERNVKVYLPNGSRYFTDDILTIGDQMFTLSNVFGINEPIYT